ncbi:MAG: hypothetical protein VX130_03755 [Verrucomicrobiota bacterium]|nr:hypothetical protein [Verrucomicrobiota bacterium]
MIIIRITSVILVLSILSCSENEESPREDFSSALPSPAKAKEGKYFFDDGSVYQGTLAMGKPDGFGRRVYGNSDVYEGQFRKGLEHGSGTLRFKSDEEIDRYVGMWASGQMEGFGALVLVDESRMEGEWKNGSLRFGEFQGANGEIKSGRWEGNTIAEMFLKEGRVRLPNGDDFSGILDYEGKYRNGSLKLANGDIFVGSFASGIFDGRGVLEKASGSLYVGQFSGGLYSGTGLLIEEDGETYSGEFRNGLPEGYGIQDSPSGVQYSGSWLAGQREGMGAIDFGDGSSFIGEFRNGFAYDGEYDWGDGRKTKSYQDENGVWRDR